MAPAFAPRPMLSVLAGAAAITVTVLVLKSQRDSAPTTEPPVADRTEVIVPPAPGAPKPHAVPEVGEHDVTAELASDAARITADYASTSDELVRLAMDSRSRWSDDRKQLFDGKLASLRHDIDAASEGRPRQKAYRMLIRYLQKVTIDDVALAEVRP